MRGLQERYLPLSRSSRRVSIVPSKRWSPDHRTPILLVSSAGCPICFYRDRFEVPWGEQRLWRSTHHRSRIGTPNHGISDGSIGLKDTNNDINIAERVVGEIHTSNLSMNSLIPSLSPVRYLGSRAIVSPNLQHSIATMYVCNLNMSNLIGSRIPMR